MSRKSLDPASWSKWNTCHLRDDVKTTKECTVWFWKYIPDPIIFAIGILCVLPGLPLFVSLIGGSEVVFFGLLRVTKAFPFLGTIPSLVFDFCEKHGARFMKDKRDGGYLLPLLVLAIWTPINFLWAVSRYQRYGFEFSTVFLYHAMRLTPRYRLFAYFNVLLHKEGHSKVGLCNWEPLNGVMHMFVGLFYGSVPYSYSIAHNKARKAQKCLIWSFYFVFRSIMRMTTIWTTCTRIWTLIVQR
jgi:hypothetical protein